MCDGCASCGLVYDFVRCCPCLIDLCTNCAIVVRCVLELCEMCVYGVCVCDVRPIVVRV